MLPIKNKFVRRALLGLLGLIALGLAFTIILSAIIVRENRRREASGPAREAANQRVQALVRTINQPETEASTHDRPTTAVKAPGPTGAEPQESLYSALDQYFRQIGEVMNHPSYLSGHDFFMRGGQTYHATLASYGWSWQQIGKVIWQSFMLI